MVLRRGQAYALLVVAAVTCALAPSQTDAEQNLFVPLSASASQLGHPLAADLQPIALVEANAGTSSAVDLSVDALKRKKKKKKSTKKKSTEKKNPAAKIPVPLPTS